MFFFIGLYSRVVKLKLENPTLKILLSVGGVDAKLFSEMAGNSEKRTNFVQSTRIFIETFSFDGLDIDWEKPDANDAVRYVCNFTKYVDIFNVMCYNYYGAWSAYTGQNAALFEASIESSYEKHNLNVAASVQNWIDAGAPKEKLVIGIPFYGRSFTLLDADDHGLHAPISGAGIRVTPTYSQICADYNNWTTVWDNEQKSPYKYSGDQWLGYDDERSVRLKVTVN
ncbi:hypothetical protein NQ314_019262 [Rhamnusium bicolor]|uniref:GH18 domain-containing protein n=1 Tax=Rhamnusium bicolor TaxID=1586634 RepID=A0AAV8WNY1_9CUCU|nr:hypothetical protein NQ314_019262 [Rhamnusium bicolor]